METLYFVAGAATLLTAIPLYFAWAVSPKVRPKKMHALICDEAGQIITDGCRGPDQSGGCPRATHGFPVQCAGRWIIPIPAMGTGIVGRKFRIRPDRGYCPLPMTGASRLR